MFKIFIFAFLLQFIFSNIFGQNPIKMEITGGVYKIPCKVNGLNLYFIFDTGASNVSISLTEANFMMKNGLLKSGDILGTEYYRIANGELVEGTKIIIRKLEIGNSVLSDIEASVVHSLNAPLLLGQSALQKLGRFTLDYTTQTITFGSTIIYRAIQNESKEVTVPLAFANHPNHTNIEVYNNGYKHYQNNNYDSAYIYFNYYIHKYPDEQFGYYMVGNVYALIDKESSLGLSVPFYQKTIDIGLINITKPNVLSRVLTSYKYFISYYYNVKKDKQSALAYLNNALSLAPKDKELLNLKKFF